ncbi:MAG: DnaA N-terminal domain-containing protein [Planctomycetota bacterium]
MQNPDLTPAGAWKATLGELQFLTTPATYNTWLRDLHLVDRNNGTWTIEAPSPWAAEWCQNRLNSTITRTLAGIVDQPVNLRFVPRVTPTSSAQPLTLPTEPEGRPEDMHRVFVGTHRFLAWLPHLGPVLWCLILTLRQHCYWSARRGEIRNSCDVSIETLAKAVGVSYSSTQRALGHDLAKVFILDHEATRRQVRGRWIVTATRWYLSDPADDPPPPSNGQNDRQMLVSQPSNGQNDRIGRAI